MELTLSAVLAVTLMVCLLITCAVLFGRGPSDVVLLFVLVFCLFYGFRPLVFLLGFDVPYPTETFLPAELPSLLTRTTLGLSLYLVAAIVSIAAVTRSGSRGWAPFFADREIDLRRALTVTLVLSAMGALVSLYLMAKYGGVGGVIVASKYEKALGGLYWIRSVSAVGAVIGITTFLDLRRRGCTSRLLTWLPLVCGIFNALSVFMWGTRGVLIVVGATLVLGLQRYQRRRPRMRRERVLVRLLVAAVLVIVAASGMRMVRDTLSHGEVQENYAASTSWRQASLGTNSIYFDAAMLSFRDWPEAHPFRGGEDFYNGLLGVVPRMIWKDKPTGIPPGKWFRQVYEPRKLNGWPMGAGALWYLNFGWLGLPLGGLVSGFVIGMVATAQRRRPPSGFNTGVAVITAVFVLPLGWDNQVLMKFIIWLGPMWVLARYIAPRHRGSRPLRSVPRLEVTKSRDAHAVSRT